MTDSGIEWAGEAPGEYVPPLRANEPADNGAADEDVAVARFVTLDEFADTPEEGEAAVLGDANNAVIPEAGDIMFYGDGGAGKTSLAVDLGLHLAAGDDWLGIAVSEKRRVVIIENEGPRPLFRQKLRRKRDGWKGSPLAGRVHLLEKPWAAFTFADERWRVILAEYVSEHEMDVVIVGPVTCAGMEAAGTMQDVRAFLTLVEDVRRRSGRRLVVILIHHENKGGQVSGAWEGSGDTLLHVQGQGHGRTRVHVQKARWASDYHATTLNLTWTEGEGFQVEEKPQLDDNTLADRLLEVIGESPGARWSAVEEATPGVNRQRRMAVRDRLLSGGRLVNVAKEEGEEVALAYCPERKPSRLHRADDPPFPICSRPGEQTGSRLLPARMRAVRCICSLLPAL